MRSLAFKLTLAFLCVGLTGAILVALFVRQQTETEFDRFLLDQSRAQFVTTLTQYYAINGSWEGVEKETRPGFDRDGSEPGEGAWNRPYPAWGMFTLVGSDHKIIFGRRPEMVGETVSSRALAKALPLEVDGEIVGWLLPSTALEGWEPGSPEGRFLASLNRATVFSALGALIVALLLGGLLARTLTHPIRELTNATRAVAKGELGHQVKVQSRDELGELAVSFNQMSADLAKGNQLRRQMTADIAHDLRTPLSVILGYTEALNDGKLPGTPDVYEVMHQEAQHLSRLIEDLRTLSLADSGELPLARHPISPKALLERVAATHAVNAHEAEVSLHVEADSDLARLDIDPERMAQVFDNLVINALRYTPQGGEIVLSAASQAGTTYLSVRDTGAGIDPSDLPFIFNRFYRGDKSRHFDGASGLGLAIARSIVEAHGGHISAESTPGEGTTIIITVPTT